MLSIALWTGNALSDVQIALPPFLVSVLALFMVAFLVNAILHEKKGNEHMEEIAEAIQVGARAFLKMEYTALSILVCLLFILIAAAVDWRTGICYLVGAGTNALCGYIGMTIATISNVKTAAAAEFGLNPALRVAFRSGSVMGLSVVSIGLLSLSALFMIFGDDAIGGSGVLAGFGMGASTVAIFARVGGGIFTKAADVGGDLVGKIEKDLPEDDIRNPATIADNVGDNVGDVAGMGADLFSSFCGSIIASSLLGIKDIGPAGVALPFWISMSGIVAAMIGMFCVRCKDTATQTDLLNILRFALSVAGVFQVAFIAIITHLLDINWRLFGCIVIGLFAGMMIGLTSEYFTSFTHPPTMSIANATKIGPANVIIQGLSVGMYSSIMPALIVAATVIAAYNLSGSTYGIALASTGLLSNLAITLATDAYGPVADNAGGIAEMAHMPAQTRHNTDILDALGNTTAAIGKGFAVGSAVLTSFALLSTFNSRVGNSIDPVANDRFGAGLLVGAMVPYFFSAMTMGAVNKAAQGVVVEVRRQWAEIPGLAEGTARADYAKCVTMITWYALHAMVFPVLLVVCAPLIIGIGMGPDMLTGYIFGAIVSGFSLGAMMSAAGGAWDNAKKYVESGFLGGKGSSSHHAAVVGDTVGDPFKDTSGPAINILIKLTSYISVVLASVIKKHDNYWWASLILIAVLIVFVPIWMRYEPASAELAIYDTAGGVQAAKDEEKAAQNQPKAAVLSPNNVHSDSEHASHAVSFHFEDALELQPRH